MRDSPPDDPPRTSTAALLHTRFGWEDADDAFVEWGANCGPGAIAAIMHMTLREVRPHMDAAGFAEKHYTNPTMMNDVLRAIGRPWTKIGRQWPNYGLVRIQWDGPWTAPGVPMRARYRYTHWIGAAKIGGKVNIFDINQINNGSGWTVLEYWEAITASRLMDMYPRSNGKWHITHAIEVARHDYGAAQMTVTAGQADTDPT